MSIALTDIRSNPVSPALALYTNIMGKPPLGASIWGGDHWIVEGAGKLIAMDKRYVRIGATLAFNDFLIQKMYKDQPDKRKHALAGGLISGFTGELATNITGDRMKSAVIGTATGIAAGLGKELIDCLGSGTPNADDFLATAFGAITMGIVVSFPL